MKKEKEYYELKECSFKPVVNKKETRITQDDKLENHVKGMESFMKIREMKKKKDQDIKRREEEVFNIHN